MATIVYLDVEDEITTAAARIRAANAPRVGMVVPFGSRVATSRINFRLLAREAQDANRRLDVVAPDASARALAASAGLPVFASVAEYEAALESGEAAAADLAAAQAAMPAGRGAGEPPTGGDGRGRANTLAAAETLAVAAAAERSRPEPARQGRRDHARPASAAETAAAATAPGATSARPSARDVPVTPSSRRRRTGALILVLALALVLGLAGAVAAVALPSADITITPVLEAVPPVSLTVRADTAATAVDPAGLVIPATSVDIPLTAQGDFPATGVSVQQTPATGSVTFDSINTVNAMPIARGTRVSTSDGITFATTDSVTVPRATVPGGGNTIAHGRASVGVVAVSSGLKGNVAAGAIDQVPSSLAAMQISVSNPAPTSGGTRTELPKIAAADVTAATAKLSKDLEGSLATALVDPSLAPQGATLFPDTARMGAATYTPDAATLAGKVLKAGQTTFSLKADASATVTAIDESPLRSMGEAAVRAAVTPGYQIVEASIQVTVGQGTVGEDGTVSYPVNATALQHRPLDGAALKSSVLGKTEAEATAALSSYGRVSIALWPFWVTAVPTSPDRVTLSVQTPVAPEPTPTPPATPTPPPTKAPPSAKPSPPGASPSAPAASSASPSSSEPPAAPSGSGETAPSGSPVPSG